MNRRQFVASSGAMAAVGESALITACSSNIGTEGRADEEGSSHEEVLMHVGTQRGSLRLGNPETATVLQFVKRHGVNHICAFPPPNEWSGEKLAALRETVESNGVSLDMVDMPLARNRANSTGTNFIMMGKSPERDRDIERVGELIRSCATAGIPAIKYYLSLLPILSTSRTGGRGGSSSRTWKLAEYQQANEITEAGLVPADLMWERITYFLERVIPVAEEYRIRMACHPHDVPTPPDFHGIHQVMGTPEGLKTFVSIQESPYHGLNLCLGTTAEMLQNPGAEIFDVIRDFGQRKKIFNIHFRNIRGKRDEFMEVYPDEGDMDMFRVALTLKEVGYPYMLMPDHIPRHPDDPGTFQGYAYGYGYIKGLIQAVSAYS